MAGNDSGQEKTEEATPKKLREARKKGQVPKSRDITTIAVLIAVFALLALGVGWAGLQLQEFMAYSFNQVSNSGAIESGQYVVLGKAAITTLTKIILPFGLLAMLTAAAAGFLQVGAMFALDPLKPQLNKLNAIEGLKNMFKAQTFIELIKNIAKIFVVFYLAYWTLKGEIGTVLQTATINVDDAAKVSGGLIVSFVIKVLLAFLAISVIDFIVQKKQFMKQMRMTKDEVKREYKQDEGDPIIKGERKKIHREMAFGDAQKQVKDSDGVVSNPTHVAVAIKYDREEMVAPEIMISGQRSFAETIKKIAEENDIPIIRNVPLAWALFELEEGTEIPEEMYEAVAEVLTYIYRLKQAKQEAQGKDEIEYA